VAEEARNKGLDVKAVAASPLAGSDDLAVFRAALREGRIMVTYNSADFSILFGDLLREGASIPGLVLVDARAFSTSDVGGLAKALSALERRIRSGEVDPSGGIFQTRR